MSMVSISKEKGLRWCRLVLIAVFAHANQAWAREPANAIPATQKLLETNISVDISELEADAPYKKGPSIILERILKQAPEVIEKSDLFSTNQDKTAKILIKLKWINPQAYEYAVTFELFYQGKPIESTMETFICKGCMEDAVIKGVLERFPQAAKILKEA